ncbi:MAG: ATP-binding protein [Salinivirgaceae bacterium]|nr:ATP-binding protein [Salinivirgaceae bacterium]
MKRKTNPPKAKYLMGSMRHMGYSFVDAISDVMDNSISAGCTTIKLLFPVTPDNIYVGILDNGCGMTQQELFHAMCYGSQANEKERSENDLGRYGLGMKSASLSQCRKMTVISKKEGKISAYRWDYDEITSQGQRGDWFVLELEPDEISQLYCYNEIAGLEHGTLVLWEVFDGMMKSSGGRIYEALTHNRDILLDRLPLIYHRFMSENGLRIFVNYEELKPLDPFLVNRSDCSWGTIKQPLVDSTGKEHMIEITPYKLPFVTEMSEVERHLIGGDDKMSKMQGYYIYRGRRLIRYGTWFGTPRHEVSKYARVKVDIPNCMDDIWKVDVMKRSAEIPTELAKLLEKTIGKLIAKSTRQTKFRGRAVTAPNEKEKFVWDRIESREGYYSYKINRNNTFIKTVIDQLDDSQKTAVEMMLQQIESNIPIHQMHLDHDENHIDRPEDLDALNDLFEQAAMAIDWKIFKGQTINAAVQEVLACEQFKDSKELKKKIHKKYAI